MNRRDEMEREAFLAERMPRLRAYVQVMTGSREDAEDIVQEACVKYMRGGPAPGTPQAQAWLFSVCRNRAINLARDRARSRQREQAYAEMFEPHVPSPIDNSIQADAMRRVEACMQKLPYLLREMLYLNVALGLPIREISEQTGIPKSTVALRVRDALVLVNRCCHKES